MNAKIKYWIFLFWFIPSFILLRSGCNESATNLLESQASELKLADIKNIVWTLTAFEKADQNIDISRLLPFHLIFDETQFFGDDGCNSFGGQYEARTGRIFPGKVSQTLRLCAHSSFPVEHLAQPYRLHITKDELNIFVDVATYTYQSDVADSIANSPLTGNWQLRNSTDPEFSEIQMQKLIPTLSFEENQTFQIIWYCVRDNSFGCNAISGIFGTGSDGRILFYQREGSYLGQGPSENFMQRILSSSSFTVQPVSPKGATLTLDNAGGWRYEFVTIAR